MGQIFALGPTAICHMPVKMVSTRFASSEGMSQSFIRSHTVYRRLFGCQKFCVSMFGARNNDRRMFFKTAVGDNTLFQNCLNFYHLLMVVRQYLRFFDNERSVMSDVLPVTLLLRLQLRELPASIFISPERKGEMLQVFQDWVVGIERDFLLLTPMHYLSYALGVRIVREDISE